MKVDLEFIWRDTNGRLDKLQERITRAVRELEVENARLRELLEFTHEAIQNSAKLRGVSASLAVARQRIGSELEKSSESCSCGVRIPGTHEPRCEQSSKANSKNE
jgi:hypothetical protein